MLIGLTGLYCSGKNHVASLFERRGFPVLDVDKLGHIAIENRKESICARFGDDVQDQDGSINRRLLGEKVFGNQHEMAVLESIVHPEANRLTLEWVAAQHGACVINAAVIHKSAVFSRLDCMVVVSAPLLTRLMRARHRDKLPWAALMQRLLSQQQFTSQYLAENADIYRVKNSGINRIRLERQIEQILSSLGLKNRTV